MKNIISITLTIFCFINSFSQKEQVQYEEIKFIIPENTFTNVDQKSMDKEVAKLNNKELNEIKKTIESAYTSRTTFAYKNQSCDCLNTFVLSAIDYEINLPNEAYLDSSSISNEVMRLLAESRITAIKNLDNSSLAKIISYDEPKKTNINAINMYLVKFELLLKHNNKNTVSKTYIIPHNKYFYQLEFSLDKRNLEKGDSVIANILQTLQLKN